MLLEERKKSNYKINLKINIGLTFILGVLSIIVLRAANMVLDVLLEWNIVKILTFLFVSFIFASIVALVLILSTRREGGI